MTAVIEELKKRREEIIQEFKNIQAEIMKECGALDLVIYNQRLTGIHSELVTEWNHVNQQIYLLTPHPEKTVNDRRRKAGLTYCYRTLGDVPMRK